jgi:hypothetical protein
MNIPVFDQAGWENYLLAGMLAVNLPFASIDNPLFRLSYQMLRPEVIIPHRDTLRTRLKTRYAVVQSELRKALGTTQKLSLALDVWSSPNHYAFLAVVGYIITSDWQLKSFLLGFEPLSGRHTGENLAKTLLDLLKFYRIQDRILAITTDNARNNDTLCIELRDRLLQELGVVWDADLGKIPCMAHVIQLVIGEIIKNLSVSPVNEKINETFNENDIDIEFNDDIDISTTEIYSNVIKKVSLTW